MMISCLFLSLNHKTVISQTMNRWIKQGLEERRVDTTMFPAHSTRHASWQLHEQ